MSLRLPTTPARVRVAPSPTGDPHVGTAYMALFNRVLARRSGGHFILRIDDTDRSRYREDSEAQIFSSLRWLGLDYDEGPDVGGACGPYRQSERTSIYREAVETLLEAGRAYRCFCSPDDLRAMRERQRTAKANIGYDGTCRRLTPEEVTRKLADEAPHVVRLTTPSEGSSTFEDALRGTVSIPNAQIDDQVLLKSDGFPTYHLATVVDDHAMGITHVIRAEEWISSTPKHVLLLDAFGWERPIFCHMPLLRNPDKNKTKISKRKNPVSLTWYRSEGFLPEALLNFLGLMGYSMPDEREVFSLEEFEAAFDPSRLKTTSPVFDLQKLEWLNGEWIRSLSADEFTARIHKHFGDRYRDREDLTEKVVPLIQGRIKKLSEWPTHADAFYFGRPDFDPALLTPKKVDEAKAREILALAAERLAGLDPFTADALDPACRALADEIGLKIRSVFMVLRVAVSGAKVSPPLFESMEVLGRDETLERLRSAFA